MMILWQTAHGPGNTRIVRSDKRGKPLPEVLAELNGFTGRVILDLRGLAAATLEPADKEAQALERGKLQACVADLPHMTVAVMDGTVQGLAFDLALCCKYRVATPDADIFCQGPALGCMPPGETLWRMAELTGLDVFFRLLVRQKPLSVESARKSGLVDATAIPGILLDRAAELSPVRRKPKKRIYKTALGRMLFKNQALAELKARGASQAAVLAVSLFFDGQRKPRHQRMALVADAMGTLAASVESRHLQRLHHVQEAHMTGQDMDHERALVIMGEGGWEWAGLLALYGLQVRWCCGEEKVLADGLCWLSRQLERFLPQRHDDALARITLSTQVDHGGAGRSLVVSDAPDALPEGLAAQLPADALCVQARHARTWQDALASSPPGLTTIFLPHDPLTSRVAAVSSGDDKNAGRAASLMKGLGFLVLPTLEASACFSALAGLEDAYNRFVQSGQSELHILQSMHAFGFATQAWVRRRRIYKKIKAAPPDAAYDLVCGLWKGLRDCDDAGLDKSLVDLAVILETGFPAHRGGPYGFLEQIQENPMILKTMGLGKQLMP